jgi:hypothetical protein
MFVIGFSFSVFLGLSFHARLAGDVAMRGSLMTL